MIGTNVNKIMQLFPNNVFEYLVLSQNGELCWFSSGFSLSFLSSWDLYMWTWYIHIQWNGLINDTIINSKLANCKYETITSKYRSFWFLVSFSMNVLKPSLLSNWIFSIEKNLNMLQGHIRMQINRTILNISIWAVCIIALRGYRSSLLS